MLLTGAGVGCTDELPPLGEALLVVDTDMPVPKLAARLRLDLYASDGSVWYESRDVALPDPLDWPASFSLYDPDEDAARSALVRLRVYPQGKVRDYRGERFAPHPTGGNPADPWIIPDPPPGETPRLVRDDVDVTPATEPQPLLAIDRLFRLRLKPGTQGSVRILMRGVCSGTQADLAGQRTCIDTERELAAVSRVELDPDMSLPSTSQQGSFGGEVPCTAPTRPGSTTADGTPLFDEEVCVPGGAFVFGNADALASAATATVPERVAILRPFRIDRFEVTVARWRQAVAAGFVSPDASPVPNEGPIMRDAPLEDPRLCTWSAGPRDRETLPLSCVSWSAARAFCQFDGGDLPTEAQWEYVAQAAGRVAKTRYPWGNDEPTCERAVYGRSYTGATPDQGSNECLLGSPETEAGPQPVDAAAYENGDVSLGLGVVHLGGNVGEALLDAFHLFDSICSVSQPLDSPVCLDESAQLHPVRGGFWGWSAMGVYSGIRPWETGPASSWELVSFFGIRCVRPGEP